MRLVAMAGFFVAVPVVGAACGGESGARETLPPIITTSTTTSTIATTTTYPEVYEIQPGDTIGIIARKFGVSIEAIVELNNLRNRNDIKSGQKLKMPPNPALTSTTLAGAATSSTVKP